MKTLPSKELMGQVLLDTEKEEICTYEFKWGRDISYSIRFKDRNNDGTFNYEDDEINLYEFAHKCKEWAYQQGYFVLVQKVNKKYVLLLIKNDECLECCGWLQETKVVKEPRYYDTEEEAMFKGCEYIIEWRKLPQNYNKQHLNSCCRINRK